MLHQPGRQSAAHRGADVAHHRHEQLGTRRPRDFGDRRRCEGGRGQPCAQRAPGMRPPDQRVLRAAPVPALHISLERPGVLLAADTSARRAERQHGDARARARVFVRVGDHPTLALAVHHGELGGVQGGLVRDAQPAAQRERRPAEIPQPTRGGSVARHEPPHERHPRATLEGEVCGEPHLELLRERGRRRACRGGGNDVKLS
mmetsp:Transcript_12468/g.33208  ORF Transcript_12468/g.33208 Transcript_12468/m.33208 type:complete len:203 (-) Transcript_12468:728-1336(-)